MENLESIKKEIESLRREITKHNYLYYVLASPEISDYEYDMLYRRLIELEEKYPQFASPDSPTQKVGALDKEKALVVKEHNPKMYSLDNVYSWDEFLEWVKRVEKILGYIPTFVCEFKIDGVGVSVIYRRGVFSEAISRGDGSFGEDITDAVRTIRELPLRIFGKDVPEYLDIRGEVFLRKRDFERINEKRKEEGLEEFANPRNAAAGSLKLLSPEEVAERNLGFFCHTFGRMLPNICKSHSQFVEMMKEFMIPTQIHFMVCNSIDEILDFYNKAQNLRETLEYDIDGIVVKVDDFDCRERLGFTAKSPRWAIAFKFPAYRAVTQVIKVDMQVGRTGIITPVANFKPVECGGVVISRATLHNFDEVKRLDLKVGDFVEIERAGDVIPKVVKVLKEKRPKNIVEIVPPERCPVCGGKVVRFEDEVYFRCISKSCPAQVKAAILHWASRAAMDIEGMGRSVVDELVDRKMVNWIPDIYKLTSQDLAKLPLFKEKKIQNLLNAIERSKQRGLQRVIFGLGIRYVGEKLSQVLADRFKDITSLMMASYEDLVEIDDVGDKVACSIKIFFEDEKNIRLIEELKNYGVKMEEGEEMDVDKRLLSGKVFVFTGALDNFSRNEAKELVIRLGGKVVNSVSKKVDFVVVGKDPGSKHKKAKQLGIKLIGEEEFLRLIEGKQVV